jgi:alkylation response protein AidB-like acyl-CoA dehydrogenase
VSDQAPLEIGTGVHHIPEVDGADWYGPDQHLQWLVRRSVGEADWPAADAVLREAGSLVPEQIEPRSELLDRTVPQLRQYDHRGQRIDDVEYHPYFRDVEAAGRKFGLVAMRYGDDWRGFKGGAPVALALGAEYIFLQADQAITGCATGMASAMSRALLRNDPELARKWVPGLASDDPDNYLTAAMFLTEKAGGSDVGANETVAVRQDDGTWRLYGEKWFSTNPTADLCLILARPQGAGQGTAGLGLFLMPRFLPDGVPDNPDNGNPRRNAYILHRLKSKFGQRALASSELGLRGAFAWQVGELGRGMKQMLDMVNATRVGIVMASAAAMRRVVYESLEHTSRRMTFGEILDSHPLMRDSLVELVTDHTACLSAGIAIAEVVLRADRGDAEADRLARILTPMLKGYAAERARIVTTEAMEVRGGNGYIEDWPNARALRDVYVHAIWEGSGNIMALDVLRALAHGTGPAYFDEVERLTETAIGATGPAAPLSRALLASLPRLRQDVDRLAELDVRAAQLRMRRLERRMAITYMAALLAQEAQEHFAETGSGRLAYIAARFATRLGGPDAEAAVGDDDAWVEDFAGIARGGMVKPETGQRAAEAVASHVAAGATALG